MSEPLTILDSLSQSIKRLKKLRDLEIQKANKAQQDIVNNRFHQIVANAEILCKTIQYARTNLSFSTECMPELLSLFISLQNTASRGVVDQEQVEKAVKTYNAIQDKTKKDWAKHYQELTGSTVNTLKTIKGLDEVRVNYCISKIEAASAWNSTIVTLTSLKAGLVQADEIIQNLKLDQEVVTFLSKITSGKATLADLNDNVLQWMQNEQLLTKIQLSFVHN